MGKSEHGVEVGSRWFLWKLVRTVEEIAARPQSGPGPHVRLSPVERDGKTRYHWTDWVPLQSVTSHGIPLAEGQDVPEPPRRPARTQREAVERAASKARAEAPKRSAVTPERRAANKITSIRYKINHPEKHGRTKWAKGELATLHATLEEAAAALENLKKGKGA